MILNMRERLEGRVNASEISGIIEESLEELGYSGWRCILPPFIKPEVLGLCSYTDKKISLLHSMVVKSPEVALDVAIHEMAHVMARGDSHGELWKEAARSIGLENPKELFENVAGLPRDVQRNIYAFRLCYVPIHGTIELLNDFSNRNYKMWNKQLVGRPETNGRLRWMPL